MFTRFFYKLFLSILLISVLVVACKKEQPVCKGNCSDITISGAIYDRAHGTPLSNVHVSVTWFVKSLCIGCTSYNVVSGNSKADGTFSFSATIDTTFFKNYNLTVQLPADTNYLTVPGVGNPHGFEEEFWEFDPVMLRNISFNFYPKTSLTIQLHRTLNDAFDNFEIGSSFDGANAGYFGIYGSQYATDSTITIPTSSDIFTKITWTKNTGGQSVQNTDSIKCTKAGPNKFDINY